MAEPSHESLAELSNKLHSAAMDRQPIPPIGDQVREIAASAGMEPIQIAYQVQMASSRARVESGRQIIGKKIGLTSPAVQQQLGVDQPDFGQLFDDMLYETGQQVTVDRLLQPRIEAELALVLAQDLTVDADAQINSEAVISKVLAATSHVLPALEIVDSRIADWKIDICDTVADNASAGVFVVGPPVDKARLDWELCGMAMYHGCHSGRGEEFSGGDSPSAGLAAADLAAACQRQLSEPGKPIVFGAEPVSTGCGAACMGNPLIAAAWLAQCLSGLGQPLKAGEIILTGALGKMVGAQQGDLFAAQIAGCEPVWVEFV